jgi:hypothetical protein
MTHGNKATRFAIALLAGAACLLVSEKAVLLQDTAFTTSAEARIGRPLTPMSYAGVARRTTRRTVAVGAAVAAPVVVAPAPVVVTPARRCVQAVDAYGRIYTRCY